jgi:hypothetical protein
MFTVGLFSTHIPYIAFVVFYAFFFLFGIQKASAGELGGGENSIQAETAVVYIQDIANQDEQSAAIFSHFYISSELGRMFFAERKTKFIDTFPAQFNPVIFCFSRFSRPPPIV